MEFLKYQHVERFGNTEVQDIELGECLVFPKIDGTNGSLWLGNDGQLCAGSRNRELALDNDNAGFMAWAVANESVKSFFAEFPNARLYGEWLVPHSLKTYRAEAWRRFYVFDVMDGERYIPFSEYEPWLKAHGIDYIMPIATIRNGSYEQFINQLAKNIFLIEDGKGAGEGIVVKRYDYVNKFGRVTWAKIVTSEFKEKHAKEMGGDVIEGRKMVEEEICNKYVTSALVEKEYAKIVNDGGWTSKSIPRLLNTVFYSLIKEDSWDFLSEHKFPVVDFNRMRFFCIQVIKARKPELF
jgi:hypothetical protein